MRVVVIIMFATILFGIANAEDAKGAAVAEFLGHLVAVHKVSTGTEVHFTGNFLKIPEQLESELKQKFPDKRFVIAKMEFADLHWNPVNLIIVIDARTGKPWTYLWDLWFTVPPFSFSCVFTGQLGEPPELQGKMTCLGKLIAFSMGGSIGQITETAEHAELVIKDRNGSPYRIMSMPKKPEIGERLKILNPSTREPKTESKPEDDGKPIPSVPAPDSPAKNDDKGK